MDYKIHFLSKVKISFKKKLRSYSNFSSQSRSMARQFLFLCSAEDSESWPKRLLFQKLLHQTSKLELVCKLSSIWTPAGAVEHGRWSTLLQASRDSSAHNVSLSLAEFHFTPRSSLSNRAHSQFNGEVYGSKPCPFTQTLTERSHVSVWPNRSQPPITWPALLKQW